MINNPAYKKFKAYCEKQKLTKAQVEATTKEQAEINAGVSISDNFADNMKACYLHQLWVDSYEDIRKVIEKKLRGLLSEYPKLEVHRRRVNTEWIIEIWLDGRPVVEGN
jgi:hypothetical protein